jgi:hypothetical protein
MDTRIKRKRFAIVGVLLLCALAMQARAATITVTNTNDSGSGSLRQALAIANDGDTINFAVTGAITLTSGGLLIAKTVTISGPGSNQLSIDGNQALFVFGLFPDKIAAISGVSIRNGQIGIWNEQGTLAVSNCVVSGNSVGGLLNDFGALSVSSCVVSGNSEYGVDNNGFYFPPPNDHTFGDASLTIDNSIVSDNSGPGVFNTGSLTIVNSTLSGNSAGSAFYGGGVSSGTFKAPGNVTVISSTITGNSAPNGGGGGMSNDYGLVNIVNSTVSGNSAQGGGGIANYAGDLYPASLVIANSTFSGNSASAGGGIYNASQNSFLEIYSTILNAGASGENIFNDGGTVTSHGYNLSSDDGGGYLTGQGDQVNTDPLLGPLQDNGGPTLTHALLPGSSAIDAGDPNFTPPPFRDQRGSCFYRVFGHRIDIGSVETQPQPRCPTPRPRPTPPR